jgi:hypothetical protein
VIADWSAQYLLDVFDWPLMTMTSLMTQNVLEFSLQGLIVWAQIPVSTFKGTVL